MEEIPTRSSLRSSAGYQVKSRRAIFQTTFQIAYNCSTCAETSRAIEEITGFAQAVVKQTDEDGLPLIKRQAERVRVEANDVQISGTLEFCQDDPMSLLSLIHI